MSSPSISLLAGLVKGYNDAKTTAAHQDLQTNALQREQMLTYLGHMASNPNIPPEHQQWAMQEGAKLLQLPVGKPIKGIGDLSQLPPVSLQPPPRQGVSQAPGMTLQAPTPPGGGAGSPQAQQPSSASPDAVGRDSSGAVNALGQMRNVQAPAPPPNLSLPGVPSVAPQTLPPGPATVIQNPQPPVPIASGGGPHVLTPQNKLAYAQAAHQEEMNSLQRQFPQKSPEELAYYAQHGEFPKAETKEVAPGGVLVDPHSGKEIYRNTQAKPGAKTGFSLAKGPSGEPVVKDNASGADLTPEEVAANPEAKKLMDTADVAQAKKAEEEIAKERRRDEASLNRMVVAFNNSLKRQDYQTAKTEVRKADEDYDAAAVRMRTMDQNLADVEANPDDQQAMISLLTNHIGMTLGAQKGARMNQAIIQEAEQSAPWLGRIQARFGEDGVLTGVVLTPGQMKSMVELAHEKADTLRDHTNELRKRYQEDLHQGGTSGKGGGKAEIKPPKEPTSGGGTVTMRAPNGQTKPIPADQVEHYKSMGAVVVGNPK